MRAVVQHRYGGPEQLALGEVADPRPGPGEVRVAVRAAAIDRGTWHLMVGLPLVARLALGLRGPRDTVVGRDVAGVVDALGEGVEEVALGDEVIGTARGSLAELAVIPLSRLAPKPASLSFAEAAALPVSGVTALQAVRGAGRVHAGQRVLVIGASGGVGSYAVQLAVDAGARVDGVCSAGKADLVRSLGASRVLDYTAGELDAQGEPYDVIVDIAGNRPLRTLRRLLTPRGTLVIVGGEGGGRWLGGIQRGFGAAAISPLVRQRYLAPISREDGADMRVLAEMADAGRLHPVVERTFALDEVAKAMDHLTSGHARGKIAITV